ELLTIADRVDLVEFAEATSRRSAGPFDVLFVEGSISTAEQVQEIARLRAVSHRLVTIGACATAGGIQAIRNWFDPDEVRATVYPEPTYVESLAQARPLAGFVAVVTGRRPQLPDEAVCLECKRRGVVCVAVAQGIPCLGPVTRTGCGAICPAYGRGCYGCFGPRESANTTSLARWLSDDRSAADVGRLFAGFTAWSVPFRATIDAYGGPPGQVLPAKETDDARKRHA